MNYPVIIGIALVVGILAFFIGYLLRKKIAEAKISSAEEATKKILEDAYKEADAKKREVLLEAKENALKMRNETEKEAKKEDPN